VPCAAAALLLPRPRVVAATPRSGSACAAAAQRAAARLDAAERCWAALLVDDSARVSACRLQPRRQCLRQSARPSGDADAGHRVRRRARGRRAHTPCSDRRAAGLRRFLDRPHSAVRRLLSALLKAGGGRRWRWAGRRRGLERAANKAERARAAEDTSPLPQANRVRHTPASEAAACPCKRASGLAVPVLQWSERGSNDKHSAHATCSLRGRQSSHRRLGGPGCGEARGVRARSEPGRSTCRRQRRGAAAAAAADGRVTSTAQRGSLCRSPIHKST
jgi:hypothetical protein